MKRALFGFAVLGFLVGLLGAQPQVAEARPASDLILGTQLNGELTKMGVLTSTGTSVNNDTTAVPFTIATGSDISTTCKTRTIMFDCDGVGFIRNGTTCSDTITNANYGAYIATHDLKQMILINTTTQICLDTSGGTVNCAVFCVE